MYNINDKVRIIGETKVGIIDCIIEETAIVRYPDGKKKININCLVPPLADNSITLTPEKFDEAVKGVMYDAAEKATSDNQLDDILEVIAAVCSKLKSRVFDGN